MRRRFVKNSMLVSAIAIATITPDAQALEVKILQSTALGGNWVAGRIEHETTGAVSCSVTHFKSIRSPDAGFFQIPYDHRIVNDAGELTHSYLIVNDGTETRAIKDPDEIELVIDGRPVPLAEFDTFIEKAKVGLRLTYRYQDAEPGTQTKTLRLNGFSLAWEKAKAACGTPERTNED